jgi:predicted nucleic acid-binding protein
LRFSFFISPIIFPKFEQVLSGFNIFPPNIQILQESGVFKGSLRAKGILLDIADCIIGLTAKLMKAEKLITRNIRHFQEFGINIESYDILS